MALPSQAEVPASDNRSAVYIVIIPTDAASLNSGATLKNKLKEARFKASLEQVNAEPETALQSNDVNHVIELRATAAFVYTKNTPQPVIHSLEDSDAAQLAKKLVRYLTSPDMINLRIRYSPTSSHFNKGYRYLTEGDYQQALTEFLQQERSEPNNADLYYDIALCYSRMGKIKEEEEAIANGRKTNPEHTGLKNLLGLIALDRGKTDDAIVILSELPDEPVFQWNLALAYASKGDLKKAQEYYRRIVKGQVDVGLSIEADRRIKELSDELKKKDHAIEQKSRGLSIVGWSSMAAVAMLVLLSGFYLVSVKGLTTLVKSIPGKPSDKLAFFGSIIVAMVTLAGNVLVALIK
jgi:tetratricopeptide (TPR) repeat protein